MATDAESLARAFRNPGRLVLGPTTTSGGFPYGGIALGIHRDHELMWHADYILSMDPASGRVAEVARNGVEWPEIYSIFEGVQWDENVLLGIFERTIAGPSTKFPSPSETVISVDNVPSPLPAWPPLLFASDDPALKSVYFRRPVPTLSMRQSVALSMQFRSGLPVRFIPTPTFDWATTSDVQVARVENMFL